MKKQKMRGQAALNPDCGIVYGVKTPADIPIDWYADMARNAGGICGNGSVLKSVKDSAGRKVPGTGNSYNARLYNYPTGQHVTIYDKTITSRRTSENFRRDYRNEDRTDAEREHCIAVSMARTKNSIYNIARSNVWTWFITFTFDRDKTDASDYLSVVKKLKKNLDNTKQRKCPGLTYLIVPELHADKTNYHFHGLLAGCDGLEFVFSGHFDKEGRPVFNVPSWKWGFTTATLVGDTAKASGYICKYVTKDTERYLFGQRRYFSNARRTDGEKCVIDKYAFLDMYADDISYMKDCYIEPAFQHVTFIEMPYNYNNKAQEKVISLSPHSQAQVDACNIVLRDILNAHPYEYRYVRRNFIKEQENEND